MTKTAEIGEANARIGALRAQGEGDTASRQMLATELAALADLLEADNRFDEARQAVHEALAVLGPLFIAKPVAHEAAMNVLVNRYLALVRRTNSSLDQALLQPIAEAQGRLTGGGDDGDDDDGE